MTRERMHQILDLVTDAREKGLPVHITFSNDIDEEIWMHIGNNTYAYFTNKAMMENEKLGLLSRKYDPRWDAAEAHLRQLMQEADNGLHSR